jgi:very-short-patch-repair endonuclease
MTLCRKPDSQSNKFLSLKAKQELASWMRQNPTPAEAALWGKLRGRQAGFTFHTQFILQGYIVDFYCGSVRLAVEVDGSVHESLDRAAADDQRDQVLIRSQRGILRFTNGDVFSNLSGVVEKIIAEAFLRKEAYARGGLKGVAFDSHRWAGDRHKDSSSSSRSCASLEISHKSRPALSCSATVNVGESAENLCKPEEAVRLERTLSLLSYQKSFPSAPPMSERINNARVRLAEYARKQREA